MDEELTDRPRDATGRPLDRDSADHREVVGELPAQMSEADAVARAEELVLTGQPFYAHEVLEVPWKAAAQEDRAFWQGLAQVAVGLTHVQRGNATGAMSLLRSAAEKVEQYADGHHGVATSRVVAQVRAIADRVEQDGVSAVPADDLKIAFRS